MRHPLLYAIILAIALATACSSSSDVCASGDTQACVCAGGTAGRQTCAPDHQSWGACDCSSCKSAGQAVVQCGCYGPAVPNQTVTATGCCSTKATQTACSGFCTGGGVPWQNICQ